MTNILILLAIAGCPGFSGCRSADSPSHLTENVASCTDAEGQPIRLGSDIVLTCVRKSTDLLATLTYGDESMQLPIERDASFHGFRACAGVVTVVDRYASNEDRLILIVFGNGDVQRHCIEHDYNTGYIHNHFSVKGADKSGISVEEWQYSGNGPPRKRCITVSTTGAKRRLKRHNMTWSVEEGHVSGELADPDRYSGERLSDGRDAEPRRRTAFRAGRDKKLLTKIRLPNKMYNSPVVADGVLYLATQRYLFAVRAVPTNPRRPD